MNKLTKPGWLISLALMCLTACYSDSVENFAEEEVMLEDAFRGISEADDALEVAYLGQAIQKTFENGRVAAACGVISHDALNKKLTIQFGDSVSCLGLFSRKRQGSLQVLYSTMLADTLADLTITFDQYIVDGRKISGTVTLHDITFDASNMQSAQRTLTNFKVSFTTGTEMTFNGTQTRQWTYGRGDTIIRNNVYQFTGSMSGTATHGRGFTQTISTPVIANFYCASLGNFPYTQGVMELSHIDGYPDRAREVNFGNGTCDKVVSIKTYRRSYGMSPR